MRVAFLTQWFEQDGADFIGGIARALVDQGAEVAVICGTKTYSGVAAQPFGPRFGRLGYRSDLPDMSVVRYPFINSHDRSSLHRFATYGSFAASSLDAIPSIRSADVVLAYCSPATAAAAALLSRGLRGAPYVLMVQDVWPDSIFATGFLNGSITSRSAELLVGEYMALAYRHASQVTALSPGMRDLLISRGTDPSRTHVIYNWTDEEAADQVRLAPRNIEEPLHLMYAGNIGPAQNLTNILEGLALLPQTQIRFSLVGDGASIDELKEQCARLHLENVRFLGRVSRLDIPHLLSDADLHLVSLADTDLFRITLPSKLQSLLAAGLPILSVAPGEVGEIVSTSGAGFAAPPGDPRALAKVLSQAIQTAPDHLVEMGEAGREKYKAQMSREINAHRLFTILANAAAEG